MKHLAILLSLFALHSSLFTLSAAVPQRWDVELAAQPPQVFALQRPRGETYELEAVLKDHGKPFAPSITNARIYWQTNGMENLYWSAPASVSNNVLRATWLPSMDPGATTVRGYIGDPGHIYAAAFQFRFIASPGATPNELPLPQKVIDFAKVTVLNPPWSGGGGGGGVNTNAVRDIVRPMIGAATNGLRRVDDMAVYTNAWSRFVWSSDDPTAPEGWVEAANAQTDNQPFIFINPEYPLDRYWITPIIADCGLAVQDYSGMDAAVLHFEFAVESPHYHTFSATATRHHVPVESSDRLATTDGVNAATNGLNAAIVESIDEALTANEKEGTEQQIVRGRLYEGTWYIGTSHAQRSDYAEQASIALKADCDSSDRIIYITYATKMELAAKQDALPYPTNAIPASVITGLEPPSSPTLRLYDAVRGCWWIGTMVNGVINWEVE